MTRNNCNQFESATKTAITDIEDNLPGLPDLSVFRDEEKKHILNVLLRDEDLRNKHIARFIKLRKEVTSLREKSQPASSSVCARCEKPFGFIFNTGGICPKCCAKVCKQCRLIYNVNENTWLCQLCCKQMQLMSYSGDWIYSLHSLSRTKSTSTGASYDSFELFTSAQNMNVVSSSDSEPEDLYSAVNKNKRLNIITNPIIQNESKDPKLRMMIQKKYDEQRLNYVKRRVEKRPKDAPFTQPLPRRIRSPHEANSNVLNSSTDEFNVSMKKLKNQQALTLEKTNSPTLSCKQAAANSKMLKTTSTLSINTSRNELDDKSISSSDVIVSDEKSQKHKLNVPRRHQSFNRGSIHSLTSKTYEKSVQKHISASMQSLRNVAHHISHPKLLSRSRITINSEKQSKPDISTCSDINNDATSLKVSDIQRISNSHTNPQTAQSSINESKQSASICRQNSATAIVSPTISVPQRIQSVSTESNIAILANRQQNDNKNDHHHSKENRQDHTERDEQHRIERSQQSLSNRDQRDLSEQNRQENTENHQQDNVETYQQGYSERNQQDDNEENRQDNTEQYQKTNTETVKPNDIEKDQRNNTLKKIESIESQEATANHGTTDGKVAKKKASLSKLEPLLTDLYASQSSLNSIFGDTKSRYDLDISGTIELKICYNMNKGALDIVIKRCKDLAHVKRNQASNPYCKIYLLPDDSKTTKRKTTVKKNTVEPEYNEIFRYSLSQDEFNSRVLWISIWSQTSFEHNYFLGEIHIPLINCLLDRFEEYTLLAHTSKENLLQTLETTPNSSELNFDLTFLANSTNTEVGTLQVNDIQVKNIYQGKHNYDIICKGLLMPGNIKRKLAIARKGPSPKWDIPLRWENISRNNLKNISIEISLWRQERFRKVLLSYIRLNSTQIRFDDKLSKSSDSTQSEKFAWELFLQKPTHIHHIQLPLRSANYEHK